MSIEEIKIALGVDLRLNNRSLGITILKSIWIEQELEKGCKKYHLSKELNLTNPSVLNICKNIEQYKKLDSYKNILQAYLTKDINLIVGIKKPKVKYYVPKKKKEKITALTKYDLLQPYNARWGHIRIINALRNENKHYLWNKLMPSFSMNDYLELQKLEKKNIVFLYPPQILK